jgi:adenylate kinase
MTVRLVVVAGVPGAGKTTLRSRLLHSVYRGYVGRSFTGIILDYGLWEYFDSSSRSFIAASNMRLCEAFVGELREWRRVVFETHWVGVLDCLRTSGLDIELTLYLVRVNPFELVKRLLVRKWPWSKVVENVFAELMNVLVSDIRDVLDKINSIIKNINIYELLSTNNGYVFRSSCCLDWLMELSEDEVFRLLDIIGQ